MRLKIKSRKKLYIIIGATVLIVGLVVANLVSTRKPKGVHVDVAVATQDSLVQTVAASGKIQPKVEVNISANVSGRILYLGAEEGEQVEKGQLLIRIEDENYLAALEQNQYALASVQASLEEAHSNLKRTRELHSANLSSDAQLEAVQASVKRFEADVQRMRANVNQARDSYDKTRLSSPIEGVVTRLNKEIGEIAIGATFSEDVIMVVSKLDSMEVNVEVNENDIVLIELSDAVEIEVFAMPDETFHGVVTEIAHSGIIRGLGTAEEVTNFEVTVAITDAVSSLRPGMSATVEVITDIRSNTLVLPQESVAVRVIAEEKEKEMAARTKGKKKSEAVAGESDAEDATPRKKASMKPDEPVEVIYVVKDDTAWVREVKLGIYSDTHFEILEGVEDGDLVVSGPFRLLSRELSSGSRVEFTPPPGFGEEDEDEEGTESDTILASSDESAETTEDQ